jgi:hypothetical protein
VSLRGPRKAQFAGPAAVRPWGRSANRSALRPRPAWTGPSSPPRSGASGPRSGSPPGSGSRPARRRTDSFVAPRCGALRPSPTGPTCRAQGSRADRPGDCPVRTGASLRPQPGARCVPNRQSPSGAAGETPRQRVFCPESAPPVPRPFRGRGRSCAPDAAPPRRWATGRRHVSPPRPPRCDANSPQLRGIAETGGQIECFEYFHDLLARLHVLLPVDWCG